MLNAWFSYETEKPGLSLKRQPPRRKMGCRTGRPINGSNARFRRVVWEVRRQSAQLKDCAVIDRRKNAFQTGAVIRRAGLGSALQRIADRTRASVVKKLLSTAPMLMYQHSRSGVSMPGRYATVACPDWTSVDTAAT